ncbi:hypothetical protein [Accumulibacter sp.]|uniref:hypothetical protein n=1 Tax=Accumulibacter sp. TaxID=2053492 RepID=UPI001A4AE6F3|nr:hypothetical protein [Accumulibacter sp.]MBL8374084.1 hypothetical protein [Accumulibacter sp.]
MTANGRGKRAAMTKRLTICLIGALATTMTSPAALAYDEARAVDDCVQKIRYSDSRYSRAHETRAERTAHHSYKVSGLIRSGDDRDHRFTCRIDNRDVVSWRVDHHNASSVDDDSTPAPLVGAGVLALIAIAAIAGSQNDAERDQQRRSYARGESSPFNDIRYLTRECAREVRFQLERDHGQVRELELTYPLLRDQTLTGDGRVSFERGGHRELSFSCDFDHRGHIDDGYYSYRGR